MSPRARTARRTTRSTTSSFRSRRPRTRRTMRTPWRPPGATSSSTSTPTATGRPRSTTPRRPHDRTGPPRGQAPEVDAGAPGEPPPRARRRPRRLRGVRRQGDARRRRRRGEPVRRAPAPGGPQGRAGPVQPRHGPLRDRRGLEPGGRAGAPVLVARAHRAARQQPPASDDGLVLEHYAERYADEFTSAEDLAAAARRRLG